MKEMNCELCNGVASLYCVSDSAFLCSNCDSKVHGANFLVARHVRRSICCKCQEFDGNRICGSVFKTRKQFCRSCSPQDSDDDHQDSDVESSCTSSTCISSSKESNIDHRRAAKNVCLSSLSDISGEISGESCLFPTAKKKTTKIVDVKAEDILVNWCRKLGVKRTNSTISVALHAFSICSSSFTSLPFRVLAAASLWLSLKLNEEMVSMSRYLKKVEEISGVPGKLIVEMEKKITRVLKIVRKVNVDLKEGWDECCN
ncbi:hypothetical protein ACHQM5_030482 [Ranunculus cassubicifolius]